MTTFVKAARIAAVVALFAVPALTLSDAASAATHRGQSAAAKACASHKKGTQEYKDCLAAYRKAHPTTAHAKTPATNSSATSGSTTTTK
ncbi:MAG TPA: hypothetical protein VMV26_16305 [Alphaproteobacteria bacterium]|jgi:hypothetical protein|nr:hypothetical protein [Alphaproteobacteria bacterium]